MTSLKKLLSLFWLLIKLVFTLLLQAVIAPLISKKNLYGNTKLETKIFILRFQLANRCMEIPRGTVPLMLWRWIYQLVIHITREDWQSHLVLFGVDHQTLFTSAQEAELSKRNCG